MTCHTHSCWCWLHLCLVDINNWPVWRSGFLSSGLLSRCIKMSQLGVSVWPTDWPYDNAVFLHMITQKIQNDRCWNPVCKWMGIDAPVFLSETIDSKSVNIMHKFAGPDTPWDWGLIWWLTILLQCFDTVGWVTWLVKISSLNDLYCVEWDVKLYSTTTDTPCLRNSDTRHAANAPTATVGVR